MRLIYICRNCNVSGGQSKIAWELASRALCDNHDVHLVARRFPQYEYFGMPGKIHAHRVFQWPNFFGQWRSRSFASFSSKYAEKINNGGIIHGFGDSYRQHVLTLGNVDWNYSKYIPERNLNKTAIHLKKKALMDPGLKILILVSRQMLDAVLDLDPAYDKSKIRYIYPGVDVSRFSPQHRKKVRQDLFAKFGIPLNAVWIVSGAGGDYEKRNVVSIGYALAKLLHHPNWVFLFVGGKTDSIKWPSELKSRSYFLGHFEDISAVLPGCDLMVYPAWYDEFSLFCLEGMASGLPLVVSRSVGVSEVVSPINRGVGLLRDPGNVEELVQITGRLIEDADIRKRIGEENHKGAQAFTWDAIYRQYQEVYREAISLPTCG